MEFGFIQLPVRVGFLHINTPFFDYIALPYAAGLLQSYCQAQAQHPERFQFGLPLCVPDTIPEALAWLGALDVLACSIYVWNSKRSLAIAQALKAQQPSVWVILGGPQVPDQAELFLRQNPQVDVCVHGQGEQVFTQLIDSYPHKEWFHIAGISYIDPNGVFIHNPPAPRLIDLNQLQSPYLTGIFEPLLQALPATKWFALWETNRGCPFSCTFCDWGSLTASKIYRFDESRLYAEIDWMAAHQIEFVMGCDANFGILPRDLEIVDYIIQRKQASGYPHIFMSNATKNATERSFQILSRMVNAQLCEEITLSLQSTSPEALKHVKRTNISLDSYHELQRRFSALNVPTYTELILGLPGETYESFTQGISDIITRGLHHRLTVYPAALLCNAPMAAVEQRQTHQLKTTFWPLAERGDDIVETLEIVTQTATMPADEMVQARTFSQIVKFLYFAHKPLQLMLALLNRYAQTPFIDLFHAFLKADFFTYPMLSEIKDTFRHAAEETQQGLISVILLPMPQLGRTIYFRPDVFLACKMCLNDSISSFFNEAEQLLTEYLKSQNKSLPPGVLSAARILSETLYRLRMKTAFPLLQHYFEPLGPTAVEVEWNIFDCFQGILQQRHVPLVQERKYYEKSWDGPPYQLQERSENGESKGWVPMTYSRFY